jgi:GH43 family beta-xylosidase
MLSEQVMSRRQFVGDGLLAVGALALGGNELLNFAPSIADAATTPDINENVILSDGQDPSAQVIDGQVYYCAAGEDCTIQIRQAESVQELAEFSRVGLRGADTVWQLGPPDTEVLGNLKQVWAPKIFQQADGTISIYATTDKNIKANQQIFAIEAPDIGSDFTLSGVLNTGKTNEGENKWAIDGSMFSYNGNTYFIWSGKEATGGKVDQNIYISLMDDSFTLAGEPIMISSPVYSWEYIMNGAIAQGINEAPHAFQNPSGKGSLLIEYSASGSWSRDYCIGRLALSGSDPLNPDDWTKSSQPVFKSLGKIYGPGSHCVIEIEGVLWLLYDNKKSPISGWDNREVRAQSFEVSHNGFPLYQHPRATF